MKALITGAAGGIGRAVAERLARRGGAQLLLLDCNADRLTATANDVRAMGAQVVAHVADVADPRFASAAIQEVERAFGGLDALVSNAGVLPGWSPLLDLSVEAYDRGFNVNTRPTWLLGQAAHPLLAASKGSLVATASISGSHPTARLGTYSASKAALIMLVRQMALEWGKDGIRANTVSPGPTLTPMTAATLADPEHHARRAASLPLGRIGSAEDVAAAIVFLLSPEGAYISGHDLAVDGGMGTVLMAGTGSGAHLKPKPPSSN
jgi:NAD(P)-dependent dehydrogenase (short-subunit alcohol dehydrogenase family)